MDINLNNKKPAKEVENTLMIKSGVYSASLENFIVRTMKEDMEKAGGKKNDGLKKENVFTPPLLDSNFIPKMRSATPPPNLPAELSLENQLSGKPQIASPPIEPKKVLPPLPAVKPILPNSILSKEPQPSEIKNRKILIFIITILFASCFGTSAWFLLFAGKTFLPTITKSPNASPSPIISSSPIPSSEPLILFRMENKKTLILGANKTETIEKLNQLKNENQTNGSFTALIPETSNGEKPNIEEIATLIGIDIFNLPAQKCENDSKCEGSSSLKDAVNEDSFTFFLYSQNNTRETKFGLIVSLKDALAVSKIMLQLEQILPSGMNPFVSSSPQNTIAFSDNTYNNTQIRYLNLNDSSSSIDYAILNDKLLFTNSKESMYMAIDRILENNQNE